MAASGVPATLPAELPTELGMDAATLALQQRREAVRRRVRASVPPIPELRYEQAYLRSIMPALKPCKPDTSAAQGIEEGHEVSVDWRAVWWITLKDQVSRSRAGGGSVAMDNHPPSGRGGWGIMSARRENRSTLLRMVNAGRGPAPSLSSGHVLATSNRQPRQVLLSTKPRVADPLNPSALRLLTHAAGHLAHVPRHVLGPALHRRRRLDDIHARGPRHAPLKATGRARRRAVQPPRRAELAAVRQEHRGRGRDCYCSVKGTRRTRTDSHEERAGREPERGERLPRSLRSEVQVRDATPSAPG